jgi:hypothetical protein
MFTRFHLPDARQTVSRSSWTNTRNESCGRSFHRCPDRSIDDCPQTVPRAFEIDIQLTPSTVFTRKIQEAVASNCSRRVQNLFSNLQAPLTQNCQVPSMCVG